MKIVITGGAGYVGAELVQRLAQRTDLTEIVVYDNLSRASYSFFLSEKFPKAPIRFVRGELLDTRKLQQVLQGADVVFHLAAKVSTPLAHQDPHSFEQNNQWGTAELSYALEQQPVRKLVYLSSVSVYGASDEEVTDDTPPNPKTYYGISKWLGERMLERFLDSEMQTYIIRCGNIYGYNKAMRFDAVINKFMFEAHYNQKITVQGNGTQTRSFISVQQVGEALDSLVSRDDVPAGVYNMVARVMSVNEVANTVRAIYPEIDVQYVQQSLTLKSLAASAVGKISPYQLFTPSVFRNDLLAFRSGFAF